MEDSDPCDGASSSASSKSLDPGRKYGRQDQNNRNNFYCNFCGVRTTGGVFRLKQHLASGYRNTLPCQNVPEHVRKEIQDYMHQKKTSRYAYIMSRCLPQDYSSDKDDDERVEMNPKRGKLLSGESKGAYRIPCKKLTQEGPLDMFFAPNHVDIVIARKDQEKEKTINAMCKVPRDKACADIARWFYDAQIPFHAVTLESFAIMCESISQFGPGLKPPSAYELRVPFLKKEVEETKSAIVEHKNEWARNGCSILFNRWLDTITKKEIVKFFVNSSKGSVFIKSMDVSEVVKDANQLFKVLDDMVTEVGEENVVQVLTDSASNYVKAGKLLMAERPQLYWIPCAAHCLDLILEDIGKNIPVVKIALKKSMYINACIHSSVVLLNMMRRFTGRRNLHRPAITRFATSFVTLSFIHKQKNNLKKMVTSKEWNDSKWSKDSQGKKIAAYLLGKSYWKSVLCALKLTRPLVKVLRMINGDKKPPIGYIYEAMDKAKGTIASSFGHKEEYYEMTFKYIDRRWECQLHQPLHAAAYFLNPEIYYSNPSIEDCSEVMYGLFNCISRLVPDLETQDKIVAELSSYKSSQGLFGIDMAVRQRKTLAPAEWWRAYGSSTPVLKRFAIRILSLTCSAMGCERNWGIFQQLHTKKRNRIAQSRLNDLVFIKSNRALNHRCQESTSRDPILLNEIDESNEWLLGRMEGDSDDDDTVFEGENSAVAAIAQASGANGPCYGTRSGGSRNIITKSLEKDRQKTAAHASVSRSPWAQFQLVDDDEEEEECEEEEEEEEEEDEFR